MKLFEYSECIYNKKNYESQRNYKNKNRQKNY